MKKIVSLLLVLLTSCTLLLGTACTREKTSNCNNEVFFGTSAEQLTVEQRNLYKSYISDYKQYIRSAVCEERIARANSINWEFTVVIDRIYLYDFSKVQVESLPEDQKMFFDFVEEHILSDCKTIICCGGYINYYYDNIWTSTSTSGLLLDMFANNTTFVPSFMRGVFAASYSYYLPEETRIIDFGYEFSFRYSPTYEEALSFEPDYNTLFPLETQS